MWIIIRYCVEYFQYLIRSVRIGFGFMWNLGALLRVSHPMVTFFGSASLDVKSDYYSKAYALGRLCASHGIAIVTGGGPSIMMEANKGAASIELEEKKEVTLSLGIGVRGVDEDFNDPGIPIIKFRYFFMRKWFLTRFAKAMVVFPGGIGTMDELFDVLNLRKHKMLPDVPLVLIGTEYWTPLIVWLREFGVARDMIRADVLDLMKITDSVQDAFELVHICCKDNTSSKNCKC